jgi:hypothetical protein
LAKEFGAIGAVFYQTEETAIELQPYPHFPEQDFPILMINYSIAAPLIDLFHDNVAMSATFSLDTASSENDRRVQYIIFTTYCVFSPIGFLIATIYSVTLFIKKLKRKGM